MASVDHLGAWKRVAELGGVRDGVTETLESSTEHMEKSAPGALCEGLKARNGQKCTKEPHYSDKFHPIVLPSTPHTQSCRSCVATARSSAQIARFACGMPAREHAHDESGEAQTAPPRHATIAHRSSPMPAWILTCAGCP